MTHFQEVLITLGASKTELLCETRDWDFWMAEYRTPVSEVRGYYLYLKHKCPLKAASVKNRTSWKTQSGDGGYEVIVTPRSQLAKNTRHTHKVFAGRRIRTSKQLLWDNFLESITWKPVSTEEYFIDPSLKLEDGTVVQSALPFLASWLTGAKKATKLTTLGMLSADGGVGKTTISRMLCQTIQAYGEHVLPILVESDQWRHLFQSTITLDSIWDLAIARRFEQANRLLANEIALRSLIQEGLLVVIFDGFDELCANPTGGYRPKDVIDELQSMLTTEDETLNARILLTARTTFWSSVCDEVDTKAIEIFHLNGFDNKQRKRYFKTRLPKLKERDIAFRISKQISVGLYDSIKREDIHEARPSGVPFVLSLIANYVENNTDAEVNPYRGDPLEHLLEDICKRENKRQSLDIEPGIQLTLFEELFREFQDDISFEDLKFYLEVVCDAADPDVLLRFTNHVFLSRIGKEVFVPRYEVLRVYFVARFLAKGLQSLSKKSQRREIARILAEQSTGKTQVIDWLLRQLRQLDDTKLQEALHHAIDIINDKDNLNILRSSSMALCHLVKHFVTASNKSERTKQLFTYYQGKTQSTELVFRNAMFTGLLKSFDFSGVPFSRCTFVDVEFKNCRFSKATKYSDCVFEGGLVFERCDNIADVQPTNCQFSPEAEHKWNTIQGKGTREEVKRAFAEDALVRALRKFKGDYGFKSIQLRHSIKGFRAGNPFNEKIWKVLRKNGVIEHHNISNVGEGGLNIANDKDLRREISQFLDNGILGVRLTQVIRDTIE
ncbi:hypothetical protein ES703_78230 [subsurface metagenome]